MVAFPVLLLALSAFHTCNVYAQQSKPEYGQPDDHFRTLDQMKEMEADLSLLSTNRLYNVYSEAPVDPDDIQEKPRVWRQVKLLTNKFVFAKPFGYRVTCWGFNHMAMLVADETSKSHNHGALGYEISANDIYYRHRECGYLPKVDTNPEDREKRPNLLIKSVCYTDRTHEEIFQRLKNFKGGYSKVARNCVDFTLYMFRYTCGPQIASIEVEPYRAPLLWGWGKPWNNFYETFTRRHNRQMVTCDVEDEPKINRLPASHMIANYRAAGEVIADDTIPPLDLPTTTTRKRKAK